MKIDGLSQLLGRENVQKNVVDWLDRHVPSSVYVKGVEVRKGCILIHVKHKGVLVDTNHEIIIDRVVLVGNELRIKIGRIGGFWMNLLSKILMGIFKKNYVLLDDLLKIDLSGKMDELGLLVVGGLNLTVDNGELILENEV